MKNVQKIKTLTLVTTLVIGTTAVIAGETGTGTETQTEIPAETPVETQAETQIPAEIQNETQAEVKSETFIAIERSFDNATYNDTSWQTPEAAEFSRLDSSGNGLLLPHEASKGKAFNRNTFAKADQDHDGYIDQNEYTYYKTGTWPATATNVTQPSPTQSQANESQAQPGEPQAMENTMEPQAAAQPEPQITTESQAVEGTSQDSMAGERRSVGEVIDDSVITTKAKAAILRTEELKTLQIHVETRQGEVTLTGSVDNEVAKMKVEEVVRSIDGVTSVKNNLDIKA